MLSVVRCRRSLWARPTLSATVLSSVALVDSPGVYLPLWQHKTPQDRFLQSIMYLDSKKSPHSIVLSYIVVDLRPMVYESCETFVDYIILNSLPLGSRTLSVHALCFVHFQPVGWNLKQESLNQAVNYIFHEFFTEDIWIWLSAVKIHTLSLLPFARIWIIFCTFYV